jgi:type VI secretion system protein ImpA
MATREDVYRQLRDAANLLQKIEPHSPIPYLIQKAITLGAMPFPLLMKALIRDEAVLKDMSRELGIPEEGESAEEKTEE